LVVTKNSIIFIVLNFKTYIMKFTTLLSKMNSTFIIIGLVLLTIIGVRLGYIGITTGKIVWVIIGFSLIWGAYQSYKRKVWRI